VNETALSFIRDYFGEECCTVVKYGWKRSRGGAPDIETDFESANLPASFKISAEVLDSRLMSDTLDWMEDNFKPRARLLPTHYLDTQHYPWELSVSAEEPWVTLVPGAKKAQVFNSSYTFDRRQVHDIKEGNWHRVPIYDARAHGRSHLVREWEENKIRQVAGVPWRNLKVDCMFYQPLRLDYTVTRTCETPIGWGFEVTRGGMQYLDQELGRRRRGLLGCLDWSAFDKYAQFSLMNRIWHRAKGWYDFDYYAPSPASPEFTAPQSVEAKRLSTAFRWMQQQFCGGCPVRLPSGRRLQRQFATILSGDLWTQVMDSWYNYTCLGYCLKKAFDYFPDVAWVLGDDSVLLQTRGEDRWGQLTNEEVVTTIADIAWEDLSMILHDGDKSVVERGLPARDALFWLGYSNVRGYPSRAVEDLLAHLCFPEREDSPAKLKARALGIAYASMGCDKTLLRTLKAIYDSIPDEPNFSSDLWRYLRYTEGLSRWDVMRAGFPSYNYWTPDKFTHSVERIRKQSIANAWEVNKTRWFENYQLYSTSELSSLSSAKRVIL